MVFYKKKLTDVCSADYKRLSSLTMGERGLMLKQLRRLRRARVDTALVYFVEAEGKILGWTLVFEREEGDHYSIDSGWNAFTYIRVSARRQGIGRELVRRVEADQVCRWYPWDKISAKFYTKQAAEIGSLSYASCYNPEYSL